MNGKRRGSSADVMRFVFIGLAVVLVIFLAFIMVNVYRSSVRDNVNIVIMDESEEMTESLLESESEKEKESESSQSETVTETETAESESETETQKETVKAEKEEIKESESVKETETETEKKQPSTSSLGSQGSRTTVAGARTDSVSDESRESSGTDEDNDQEEENIVIVSDSGYDEGYDEGSDENANEGEDNWYQSTGNYVSLSSTCYFRSEPGYEDAYGNDTIMWELPGGTVVEVLYDNGGWAEVQVDGVVGYVGSKFLAY